MTDPHRDRLTQAFTQQAVTMEDPALNTAFTSGLGWLVELAGPRPTDRLLDVAGGTGLVARAFAPHVESVTVVDITVPMLEAGRAAAAAEGLDNVSYLEGDATDLPFGDGSFGAVVTRFSLHHVPEPERVLDEIVRVTAAGGWILVKDLTADADERLAARQDEIEILRDDSHLRMPRPVQVGRWLQCRGCTVTRTEQRQLVRPLEPWLEQSVTPPARAQQVRDRLAAEIDGGEPTGTQPERREDGLWFRQTWEATLAVRP
ncbi:class I SAM-dependent methyltransferase [Ornithinicoccus hortensis]|uniref:Methyltransferase family protein n=1 Tax=Ornithinicoccus hortensis TaxID=82346 RepID=A0A542YTB1_9MICO|nr:methyltransferase domain-containing protein [Ornithinicoccus hortensis]TQL51333.1 methyltransferase family protein [Ornithinicoccus hortensis]